MSVEYKRPRFGQEAGFCCPARWSFDGDLKCKAPVLDLDNENRVVRYCGYRRCLRCTAVMWTEDVCKVRICLRCKSFLD
jgi:hypothetical protein